MGALFLFLLKRIEFKKRKSMAAGNHRPLWGGEIHGGESRKKVEVRMQLGVGQELR